MSQLTQGLKRAVHKMGVHLKPSSKLRSKFEVQRDPVQPGRMQFNLNIYRDAFYCSWSEKPSLIALS